MKKLLVTLLVYSFAVGQLFALDKKVVIEGSTTVLPIAQAVAEEFMAQNASANLSVRGGGSGVGIASLIDKTCDIADSSRAIKDEELKKAAGRGVTVKAHVVAMDGIAVIVNNANGISALTKKDVKAIYTGSISDWSKVGGPAGKIVVISRDSASGTFEAFGELALEKAKVRSDALMQASNQAIASIVAKTPGAIGYVGLGYVTKDVKALTINGVECTVKTVLTKQYPYSRPLFMYTNGKPEGTVKAFLDFLLGTQGQKIVAEQGFVALN
jgi:phosphate transport system substrate-binding protein